ncbi:cysteine--tRNA ligase [Candidatus Nomurabacteria bacterium CG1_02_31_12]|uniref:Cysteine--tRNA ligase n=2 Tax=Candidatus Nomuraibacteriota TaxID=1752729 RepID=A0A1J4UYP1_9BACT|nr:MAG: cysteine--tRNA ligase [Candidatus Nomurabacteria bacterium CG1_02_31_12]
MSLKFYNTLTREKENFVPINKKKVNFFVCGPTVYDYPHLGHGKTYTQFDVLVRALRYFGYEVFYLQNITDIDDKIINRAKEQNISPKELSEKFEKIYLEDMTSLGNTSINKYARATDYVPQIIKQVETLIEKGYAYKTSDGIYFETIKFKNYGKLSGRTELKEDDAVSRIDESKEKKGWNDFCLWKAKKEGEPSWDAPFGKGRPGWHIEDTAITETFFGPQYDVHGGARDLIFPHHECEIAQMESASGHSPLVKYWLHTGFLNIDSKRMGKSNGNFKTLRGMIESGISPMAFRFWVLMAHYRSPMNWNQEALEGAYIALKRLYKLYIDLGEPIGKPNIVYQKRFKTFLEDDLDTPRALSLLWDLVKDLNISPSDKKATILDFDKVLGLDFENIKEEEKINIPEEIIKLAKEREDVRKNKDFKKSDEIRDKINSLGYEIKDNSEGPEISKI